MAADSELARCVATLCGERAVGARLSLFPAPLTANEAETQWRGVIEAWRPDKGEHLIALDGSRGSSVGRALLSAPLVRTRSELATLVTAAAKNGNDLYVRLASLSDALTTGWVVQEGDEPLYCVCRRPEQIDIFCVPCAVGDDVSKRVKTEWWVQCAVCAEWFHPSCVGTNLSRLRKTRQHSSESIADSSSSSWECPLCRALLATHLKRESTEAADKHQSRQQQRDHSQREAASSPKLQTEQTRLDERESRKMRALMARFARIERAEAKARAEASAISKLTSWRKELRTADPLATKFLQGCHMSRSAEFAAQVGVPYSVRDASVVAACKGEDAAHPQNASTSERALEGRACCCSLCERLRYWSSDREAPLPSALLPAMRWEKCANDEWIFAIATLRHLCGDPVALGAATLGAASGESVHSYHRKPLPPLPPKPTPIAVCGSGSAAGPSTASVNTETQVGTMLGASSPGDDRGFACARLRPYQHGRASQQCAAGSSGDDGMVRWRAGRKRKGASETLGTASVEGSEGSPHSKKSRTGKRTPPRAASLALAPWGAHGAPKAREAAARDRAQRLCTRRIATTLGGSRSSGKPSASCPSSSPSSPLGARRETAPLHACAAVRAAAKVEQALRTGSQTR